MIHDHIFILGSSITLNIDIVAYLILHASMAEFTAQLLSLSYVYLISSDEGSIVRIVVQIKISEVRVGYEGLMGRISVTISYSFHCLTTETIKYINIYIYIYIHSLFGS